MFVTLMLIISPKTKFKFIVFAVIKITSKLRCNREWNSVFSKQIDKIIITENFPKVSYNKLTKIYKIFCNLYSCVKYSEN